MNENVITFMDSEEDILTYEVSDQALEGAAEVWEGKAASVTLAFCSGLDTCPS
jgi:hypothetical protein